MVFSSYTHRIIYTPYDLLNKVGFCGSGADFFPHFPRIDVRQYFEKNFYGLKVMIYSQCLSFISEFWLFVEQAGPNRPRIAGGRLYNKYIV